ncbi:MAG: NTPase [Candidatus Bilamarchaeaceae archaeon]
MPNNFFITGLPKSGKTTLLMKLIDELKKQGKKVGGFLTPEQKEHGSREGFLVKDIDTGKSAVLAVLGGSGPKVGKYGVNIKDFEGIALLSMKKVDKYDVFVIDEIGKMEMKSKKFVEMLDKVFESKTPVIASIGEDFLTAYAHQGEIFVLTPTNREGVFLEILHKTSKIPLEKVSSVSVATIEQENIKTTKKTQEKASQKNKKINKKEIHREKKPAKNEEKAKSSKKEEDKSFLSKLKRLIGF